MLLTHKVAGIAGSLTNTIMSLVVFGLNHVTLTETTKWIMSLVPPFALTISLEHGLTQDSTGHGLSEVAMCALYDTTGFSFSNDFENGYGVAGAIVMSVVA